MSFPRDSLSHDTAAPMHDTSIAGVDDMAELGDLHEGAILYNIYQRYKKDIIYVSPNCLSRKMAVACHVVVKVNDVYECVLVTYLYCNCA